MSHRYYDGTIYHKRFSPKKHEFKYKFFMVDVELSTIDKLKNRFFSKNRFNLFSFYSRDHFGNSDDFITNVNSLLNRFAIDTSCKARFITLPRVMGFVFNPISLLVLFKDDKPYYLLAEVHNYNGGRVIYPVKLSTEDNKKYTGDSIKDMHVSPFFKRDGEYKFTLFYNNDELKLNILLFENEKKVLSSTFQGKAMIFNDSSQVKLFFKHTLLTVWVVTRTLYQSIKLWAKGLSWSKPIKQDQIRRF